MASQMLSLVCLLFTLMVHNSAGSLLLDVIPTDVVSGLTRSLTVNCSFSFANITNISGIISLIVSRSDEHEQFFDLASLNAFTPGDVTTLAQIDAEVSGHIDPNRESYLSVVLPFPKDNDTGVYRCEMNGMDNSGHPSELFQTSTVSLLKPNMDEVSNELSQLHHELQFLEKLAKNQSDQISEYQSHIKLEENLTKNQSKEISDMENKINIFRNFLLSKVLPDDFDISQEYNGHYYLLSKEYFRNATVADQTCQSFGGYLVQINDASENQFLKYFVGPHGLPGILVSGTDTDHEGQWTFTGSDTDLEFFDWGPGEGVDDAANNCIVMYSNHAWQWADVECTYYFDIASYRFLCEF